MRASGVGALLLAALVLVGIVLAGCGEEAREGDPPPALRTNVPTVRRLLAERLERKQLNFSYVVCVRSPARFEGGPVVRCNVNFNAPHIEIYCGVVQDGELVTNHESTAVPCPRDHRGEDPPVRTYGG